MKNQRDAFVRTDLALETTQGRSGKIDGVIIKEENFYSGDVVVTSVRIENEEGKAALGKPIGSYVTVAFPSLWLCDDAVSSCVQERVSSELADMIGRKCKRKPEKYFVAGLGNSSMTADSVGCECVGRINVTRHIKIASPELFSRLGRCEVSALCPGVLAQTGIESAQLLRCAIEKISPDVVIAVDSLAARSPERLARTIQLSDTGICPGSGVGNRRMELSEKTLGVPVIALGVPTVVDSSTLISDALAKAGMGEPTPELRRVLEEGRSFFVTLKEADAAFSHLSKILAAAIDDATRRGL